MSYTGFSQTDPLGLPSTINPSGSLAELNPLPPPGRPVDGTADQHPTLTAIHEAKVHTYTFLGSGTITTGGVWTFVFTPTKLRDGLPIADALGAVTLTVTVGATETATALGALLVTAYTTAKTMTGPSSVDTVTRIGEIVGSMSADTGTVTILGAASGETFTLSVTPQSGGTATVTNTVDAAGTDMRIGVFVTKTGLHTDGVTAKVRACQAGDTAASIYGIVADGGTRIKPIDSAAGYSARYYPPGRSVPILPLEGHWTCTTEAAITDDSAIYVRTTTTGSEIAGAANDTATTDTVNVWTMTPTAANTTVYRLVIDVYNFWTDAKVATGIAEMTSDADGTAAEIVTGLTTSIQDDNDSLDSYVTVTGSATLILTAAAGYYLRCYSTGPGDLAEVETTAAASDHVKLPKGKFSRTTTAAGVSAVQF